MCERMQIEDRSRDPNGLADDIRSRALQLTVARFSFAFPAEKLNAAARALMNCGLRFARVDHPRTILMVEVPMDQVPSAVALCLDHSGEYVRVVSMPS